MKTFMMALFLLLSLQLKAATYVAEFKKPLSTEKLNQFKKVGLEIDLLAKYESSYFQRAYVIKSQLEMNELKEKISTLAQVVHLEKTIRPNLFNIIPGSSSKMLVNDKLFPYQWSLYNQGQSVLREVNALQTKTYPGVNDFDLNWSKVFTSFKNLLKKNVVVAILDTGVDYTHPEIAPALLRNEVECNQAQNEEAKDLDNNGMIGDCLGWNFTRPKDSPRARDVMDFAGHGTHLAGIISAQQNDEGIVGVAPDIKILPLKVVMEDGAEADAQIDFSDRLTAAIVYAVKRKVDVINLSLGWPRSLDADHLRKAIDLAQSQGIFIVAAAGNNNSDEPIFPCAYEGVVCVGASTIDKKAAGFSNYGSTVDVFAPGESILSTYPQQITPDVFHIPGYEFKSGTSQASPMVAATLAILKSQSPDEHPLKTLTRLYKSSKKFLNDKEKFSSFGQISIQDAMELQAPIFVKPQIKLLRQILFSSKVKKGTITIPVLSHHDQEIEEVVVTVESLSSSLQIATPEFKMSGLRKFEVRNAKFNYDVINDNEEAAVTLKITMKYSGIEETYLNKLPLIRDIRNDSEVAVRKFKFQGKPLPVGSNSENQLKANISTIDQFHQKGEVSYFMKRSIVGKEEVNPSKQIEITVFDRQESTIDELPTKVILEDATQLISIMKIDANYDQKLDYMIQYVFEKDNKRSLRFLFLDKNLNPLFKEFSTWNFLPDAAVIDYKTLGFLKGENKQLGSHIIPVFLTEGGYPTLDQDPSIWVKPITTKAPRLYYLSPKFVENSIELETRVITTTSWVNSVQESFNLKWTDPVHLFDLLTQDEAAFYRSELNAVLLAGVSSRRTTQQMTIRSLKDISYKPLHVGASRLESMTRKKLFNSTENISGDTFWNTYDQSISRLVTLKVAGEETNVSSIVHRNEVASDTVLNHIASFELPDSMIHFIQTKNKLLAVFANGNGIETKSREMLRFSFLPGKLLSEIYYPIWTKQEELRNPSLYVDSTQISGNRIYVMVAKDNEFIAPAKFSVFIPASCKAMNPMPVGKSTYSYELLCIENNEWVLRSLKLL
jgi:cell wall-associated protease